MKFPKIKASHIYFWIRDISGCENFLSKISLWNFMKKKKKKSRMFYFLFLMLSSSSIKELLHKPAEIQWNITETLPGKLRRKISWALSFEILPPENTKMWEIAIFGVLWGPGNLCVTPWFLSLTLNIVVKTVLPSN